MRIIILRVCKTGRTCVLCASSSIIHHLATSQLCQHLRYAFYKNSEPLDFEGISLPCAIGFSRHRASDFHTALRLLKFREKSTNDEERAQFLFKYASHIPETLPLSGVQMNGMKNGGYTLNHSSPDAEKNRYCITT